VTVGIGSWISVGDEVLVDLGVLDGSAGSGLLGVLVGIAGSGSLVGLGVAAFIHPTRLNKMKTILMDKENRKKLILHPSR
jgi:hypothetical protein